MVEVIFRKKSFTVEVLPNEEACDFNFVKWNLDLDRAIYGLEASEISGIQISEVGESAAFATIYKPNFFGATSISEYCCVAEFTGSLRAVDVLAKDIADALDELTFLSISIEESLEVSSYPIVDFENFPWGDWRLVLAYVKNHNGRGEFKKGPAYQKLISF